MQNGYWTCWGKLSTPSLGITGRRWHFLRKSTRPFLSTPSLGITKIWILRWLERMLKSFQLPLSGSHSFISWYISSLTFFQLPLSGSQETGTSGYWQPTATFQLPLSGSLLNLLEGEEGEEFRLSTPSLGITVLTIVSLIVQLSFFQLPLSGSRTGMRAISQSQ